jgi:hypothetical protein
MQMDVKNSSTYCLSLYMFHTHAFFLNIFNLLMAEPTDEKSTDTNG